MDSLNIMVVYFVIFASTSCYFISIFLWEKLFAQHCFSSSCTHIQLSTLETFASEISPLFFIGKNSNKKKCLNVHE